MRRSTPSNNRRSASKVSYDLRILNAIRQIIRAADIDSRRLAAEHQITSTQLVSLLAIVKSGSATAHDVARRVHVGPSTLVGVLDRLEAKGFIARQRRPEDRREITIVPTPAGRALAAATPFPLQHALNRALCRLSEPQREELAAWVERLVDLMGVCEISAAPMLEIKSVRS